MDCAYGLGHICTLVTLNQSYQAGSVLSTECFSKIRRFVFYFQYEFTAQIQPTSPSFAARLRSICSTFEDAENIVVYVCPHFNNQQPARHMNA
jgi:hypothetical protein